MKKYTLTILTVILFSFNAIVAQSNKLVSIFDGKTLSGWRAYQNKPNDAWSVEYGLLHVNGPATTKHADLITEAEYDNFKLVFDWKIAKGSNSGLLYLVSEKYPESFQSGPEYQLIDDKGYPEKLANWQKTGANYAMNPPTMDATVPAGKWNHTVIIVNRGLVEHWLNGKRVVGYELWNDEWKKAKAEGKWKDFPGYGTNKSGHIAIQDYGGEAWFKNIKIQRL